MGFVMGNMLKTLWKVPVVKHAIKNKILQQSHTVFNKMVKDYLEGAPNIDKAKNFVALLRELVYPFKNDIHVLWNSNGNANAWRDLTESLNYVIKNSVRLKMMIDRQLVLKLKPINKFIVPPEGLAIDEAFAFKLGQNDYFLFTHHSNDDFIRQIFKNFYYQFYVMAIALNAGLEKKRLTDQIQRLKNQLLESTEKISEVEKNLKKRMHEIDQIFQVSNELFTIHDREGLINTALLTLVGQLGCDRAFILLKNKDGETFSDFYSKGFGSEQNVYKLENSDALARYFESGGEILYTDEMKFKGEAADLIPFFKETGARMVAPVMANKKLIGIMACGEKLFGGDYDLIDKRIFKVLSNTINLAFTNLQVYEQVASESFVDKNTGLANKKYFEQRVQEEKSLMLRQNSTLGLLVMRFKNADEIFNHLEEHQINRLDRIVIQRISPVVRTEDFLALIESGKYALLMPGITDETIHIAMNRFKEKMASLTLPDEFHLKEIEFEFEFAIFPDQEEAFEEKVIQLLGKKEEKTENGEDFFTDLDFNV
ncbi:diguanylate cyclase [Caldithrix abyssi DSM 13497]|uniref:Diguanylate cyclase n=2 Tax=Caldithrix abyssi DSM 13497 TaxID=880073 RepID=H1XSV0_CALAY|nr:diguanylate cyclase [Caldithrix abyssi DSM 13497]